MIGQFSGDTGHFAINLFVFLTAKERKVLGNVLDAS